MAAKNYWSEGECEKLIEIVRNLPILWKTDHVHYGKRGPRYTAWKAVARLMESDRGELEFLIGVGMAHRLYDSGCKV